MDCPHCGAPSGEVRILETNHTKTQTRRRRRCLLCDQRFSTVEVVVKDGERTSAKDMVILPGGTKDALTR